MEDESSSSSSESEHSIEGVKLSTMNGGHSDSEQKGKSKEDAQEDDKLSILAADVETNGKELLASPYASVKQESTFSARPPKFKTILEWKNINYSIQLPVPPKQWYLQPLLKLPFVPRLLVKKMERQILHNVSGIVRPGEMVNGCLFASPW